MKGYKQMLLATAIAFPGTHIGSIGFARSAAAGEVFIEDIVVTARKREERLIDVPVSVAAFSGAHLEQNGIENVEDLYGSVPSLYFTSNVLSPGSDFQFLVIRGVGANSQLEPSTATFIDGVYTPSLGFDIGFMDLERVEILRGPQGTLFGRNTQGGALNIVTRKPGEETKGKIAIEADEFNSVDVAGVVEGAAVENKLYVSLAGRFRYTDGYAENTYLNTDADDWRKYAGRAAFRFVASDSVEVTLRVDGDTGKGHSVLPGFPEGCDCYDVSSEFQENQKIWNWGFSAHVEAQLSFADLTAITGYRKLSNVTPFDFDGSSEFTNNRHDLRTKQRILSQEIRLSSSADDSRLTWVAGVYGYDERLYSDRQYSLFDLNTFFDDILNRQTITTDRKGWAAFGQVTFAVTDRLDITAGIRYTHEKVDNLSDVEFSIVPIGFFGQFLAMGEDTFKDFSPMGSISYNLTDDVMTYVTVSKGFKGGGFDRAPGASQTVRPVDEETSINYEWGLKGTFLDGRLSADASIYRVDIKDQQLQTVILIDGIPFSAIANAGKSHSQGVEFNVTAKPVKGLSINANLGYTKTKFDSYVDGAGVDRAGESFTNVPKWTAAASAEYAWPVGSGFDLSLYGAVRYVDNYHIGSGNAFDPRFNIDSYVVADVRLTLSAETWDVSVFADNLFDDYIVTNTWNAFFFAGDSVHRSTTLPPRRIGIRATYQF